MAASDGRFFGLAAIRRPCTLIYTDMDSLWDDLIWMDNPNLTNT